MLTIKRTQCWSSCLLLTVRMLCRTLCLCGLRWCGNDIFIAIGITNIVNHCLWMIWLTIDCFIIWTVIVQRFVFTRIMLARIMLSNWLFKALCWQEFCLTRIMLLKDGAENRHHVATETLCRICMIWNNVCHISKNYVDNRRAENLHCVATDNLCRIYYKLKQWQTGLKIEITIHIRIGDVALLYILKNIMVICYLLGVWAENWHYVAT